MAGGAGIDPQPLVGRGSEAGPHEAQTTDKLLEWQFELTDQNAARGRDGEAGRGDARGQAEGEIGDQQGFTHLGFPTHKQDALLWQQSRFDQTGRSGLLFLQQLSQG
jgi:hypothetical protein